MYDIRLHQGIWGVQNVESLFRQISRPTVYLFRVSSGEKRRIRSYLNSVVISIFRKIHRAYRDRLPGLFHIQQTNWLKKSMRCRQHTGIVLIPLSGCLTCTD
jgi:hypothetical protein